MYKTVPTRLHHRIHRAKKHFHLKNVALYILAIFLLCGGASVLWVSSFQLPDLSAFESRLVSQSTKIYDRTGTVLLYDIHSDQKRTTVAYDKISKDIKNATVAIEDADFYQHHGVQLKSFLRALLANIVTGSFGQGGSTITQQVVKNSLLTTEKKISRKIKEWVLALKLEKVMTKEQILAVYLNENPYGGNVYGVEEAAQTFFGRSASDVTLAEAAYLASLPQAPTFYSPYGNNRARLDERKNLVLSKMKEKGFISENEYNNAMKEVVIFKIQEGTGIKAPHFVAFVRQYLEDTYGKEAMDQGGFKVTTTLDYNIQKIAEEIVKEAAIKNQTTFNAENAALVAIDPKTGQILTMVGSRDYFDKEIDGNFNVTLAKRQPGSSFKPFVYATAFKEGFTPETVLFDAETEFNATCPPDGTASTSPVNGTPCYSPQEADGKFLGPLTIRKALAQSRNLPAIKALYLAGINESLRTAKDMGITTLTNASQYGLTLVLGGGEVSPLDMTSAYGVFANDGVRNPYTAILKIEDMNDEVLEQFTPKPTQVLSPNIARTISDILSDDEARTPVFVPHSLLYFSDRDVAVKTGTTNNVKDVWTMGYTPNLVVGVWGGNNNNLPMIEKNASIIIAPLFHSFMREVFKTLPKEDFTPPDPINTSNLKPIMRGIWQGKETYFVDRISGGLATSYTPEETKEERAIYNPHSILFYVDKSNPQGPAPEHPENDPQFNLWEYGVQKWLRDNPQPQYPVKPLGEDNVHTPANSLSIKILSPLPGSSLSSNSGATVLVQPTGQYPIQKIDVSINGVFVGSTNRAPYSVSFLPPEESVGQSTITVTAIDSIYNKATASVNVVIR
jgi:1A family penicillin-binding protein